MPICQARGCLAPALFRPILLLPAPAPYEDAPPLRAALGLVVCELHRRRTTLDDLLTAAGYRKIAAACAAAGVLPPDPAGAQLEWDWL